MNGPTEQMGFTPDDVIDGSLGRAARRYLLWLAIPAATLLAGLCLWLSLSQGDHLGAISRPGDASWFRDFGGEVVTEIQDQDLFYHDIGGSIRHVKDADVIVLGSSLVSFALDEAVIRERLEQPYGLKVYNMAFVGVASSEFARRIAQKHHLRPRLWILNADDGGGGGNFFHRNLTRAFGADVRPIPSTTRSRFSSYATVIRRNIHWRLEDATRGLRSVLGVVKTAPIPSFERNVQTGAADMRLFPRFAAGDNGGVKMTRDPDCHTTPDVIANARELVQALDAPVVLTLVPNYHGCFTQVREIADAIGVETALPARTDYSSWDSGGHLDARGAADFTRDLAVALERTRAFQGLRDDEERRKR
ncbi:hypothetical protein [Bradyrhizobium sp. HKCCYLS20291]|uniref:hypothetical protein n=1 Tax=Bradyrhizobium sp. HKCCYLS20291 TaxID=3420766 RepID=UPI003EBEB703